MTYCVEYLLLGCLVCFDIILFIFYCWVFRVLGVSQVALLVKNLSACAGDIRGFGLISGSGRFPGGGHRSPLQYSCLENPMDRGAWWATVHGVAKSLTQLKWLSTHARVLCVFWITILLWYVSFAVCGLYFSCLDSVFYRVGFFFNLSVLSFMSLQLSLGSHLLTQGHLNFILCFLLLRFYSLHFTFRFVTHYGLIFVSRLLLFFWHMYVQLFSTICWKNFLFSIALPLHLC